MLCWTYSIISNSWALFDAPPDLTDYRGGLFAPLSCDDDEEYFFMLGGEGISLSPLRRYSTIDKRWDLFPLDLTATPCKQRSYSNCQLFDNTLYGFSGWCASHIPAQTDLWSIALPDSDTVPTVPYQTLVFNSSILDSGEHVEGIDSHEIAVLDGTALVFGGLGTSVHNWFFYISLDPFHQTRLLTINNDRIDLPALTEAGAVVRYSGSVQHTSSRLLCTHACGDCVRQTRTCKTHAHTQI